MVMTQSSLTGNYRIELHHELMKVVVVDHNNLVCVARVVRTTTTKTVVVVHVTVDEDGWFGVCLSNKTEINHVIQQRSSA